MKILFQGDSITDAGRFEDIEQLGYGYVRKVAEELPFDTIINKGISGHRTNDLLLRWKEDALDINADIIFILIGVNDVWHHFRHDVKTNINIIEKNYNELIKLLNKYSPQTKIVILEPFSFPIGEFLNSWLSFLDEVRELSKNISDKYNTYYIPLQKMFNENLAKYQEEEMLGDGVHPTDLGHGLIKDEVIDIIKKIKKDF